MMLMLSGMLTAQTVDNPPFKARSGSIGNITRIERTPDGTRVYIHAIFRPHWWIKEEGDSYLEDAATGKKYQFKSAEGIELNKEVYMPDSGEMDYVLVFEALPEETQVIHLLSPSDTEGNTYDISLVPSSGKNVSPLAAIKGNWFKADDLNTWEYGIYDSVTIMDNRIFTNENIRKKGKRVEITVKDKQNGDIRTLLVTPQKDGSCQIQVNGEKNQLYTRQRGATKTIAADTGFQQFFPGNICFFKFLRQNSKFLQKLVLCQIHVNSSLSLSIQRTGFFFFRTHPGETRPRCVLTHRRDYSTFIPASQVKSLFKNAHFHFNLSANFLNFP